MESESLQQEMPSPKDKKAFAAFIKERRNEWFSQRDRQLASEARQPTPMAYAKDKFLGYRPSFSRDDEFTWGEDETTRIRNIRDRTVIHKPTGLTANYSLQITEEDTLRFEFHHTYSEQRFVPATTTAFKRGEEIQWGDPARAKDTWVTDHWQTEIAAYTVPLQPQDITERKQKNLAAQQATAKFAAQREAKHTETQMAYQAEDDMQKVASLLARDPSELNSAHQSIAETTTTDQKALHERQLIEIALLAASPQALDHLTLNEDQVDALLQQVIAMYQATDNATYLRSVGREKYFHHREILEKVRDTIKAHKATSKSSESPQTSAAPTQPAPERTAHTGLSSEINELLALDETQLLDRLAAYAADPEQYKKVRDQLKNAATNLRNKQPQVAERLLGIRTTLIIEQQYTLTQQAEPDFEYLTPQEHHQFRQKLREFIQQQKQFPSPEQLRTEAERLKNELMR